MVVCSCGREICESCWSALPFKGSVDSGIPGVVLELRNDRCGSTVSRPVREGKYITAEHYRELERQLEEIRNARP
jgi:hypothetical protein